MYILGVTGYNGTKSHDAAAALIKDGRIVAAAEEERFSRTKHARGLSPVRAIEYCLKTEGIGLGEVAAVAHGWNHLNEAVTCSPAGGRNEWIDNTFPREIFTDECFPPIYYVRHHLAHIAGAFYTSGFENAACLCIDGQGESEAITLAYAEKDQLRTIAKYDKIYSLGALYEAAATYAGLGYGVPGKLMGLAPYGSPRDNIPLDFDSLTGRFTVGLPIEENHSSFGDVCDAYLRFFERTCYPFRRGTQDIMSYVHFAASVQATVERAILAIAQHLKRLTGSENLVLCGGVALNCTCNGQIERSRIFQNTYVPPGANDASCSFGAALEVYRIQGGFSNDLPKRLTDPRLGFNICNEDVEQALIRAKVHGVLLDEKTLCEKAASALAAGNVILWCQGRAEFGPRALGSRSILASPTMRSSHLIVNQIKKRELWRPLSPSVLEKNYADFFSGGSTSLADFMLKADTVIAHAMQRIPAVTHIDGSARPQAVRQEEQPRYYRLIEEFEKLSSVPIVLNTSLNVQGEPIVNTPAEALSVFLRNDRIAAAIIGNYFVARETVN